jgi:hypothetical protein
MRSGRRVLIVGVASIAVAAGVVAALVATRGPDPLQVVRAFTASRNAGDVDLAMSYLADEATIFGFSIADPLRRERVRQILAAQAVGDWTIHESNCTASGAIVTCRYAMDDQVLRRWGLSFTGRHEYVIREGKVASQMRYHDDEPRRLAYAALADFRAWVRGAHPDLLYVIWSDAQSVTYATPEGAAAMLGLLDEYEAAK